MQQAEPTYPGIVGLGSCTKCHGFIADIEKLTTDLQIERGNSGQFKKQLDAAHKHAEQLQQQLTEAVAEKNRLQCNVEYQQLGVRVVDSMAGSCE